MIRKYESSDRDDVVAVWAQASALAHPFLSREFQDRERLNVRNVYLPMAETWVCETEGRVVGFLALLGNEVGGLFVDPSLHRSGIGRSLLDRARMSKGDLEVEVFEKNRLGRAFYDGVGFELMHEKVHEPTGFKILRLRLAAAGAPASG